MLLDVQLLYTDTGQEMPKQINMILSKIETILFTSFLFSYATIIHLTNNNVKYIIIIKTITFCYDCKETMMELAKLRYFYTVAKLGHVTRAAEEIHIAQPALTKAIKQLEEELDAPLFYKQGRNIRLTPFGVYLQGKIAPILEQLDTIPGELAALKQERQFTVKLNVLAASSSVTEAVVCYKKQNPSVIFQLIRNEAAPDCDVSVTTNTTDISVLPPVLTAQSMEEKIYLAVPKNSRYAEKSCISLTEVKEEGFVHLAGSRTFSALCDRFCMQAGFKPHIAFESDSLVAVKNIISANAGVGFWPAYSWGKLSSDVLLLPIVEQDCKRVLTVSLHESAYPSSTSVNFYEFLVKFLQKRKHTLQKQ